MTDWLDGRRVWEWIVEQKPPGWTPYSEIPETYQRRISDWRRGSKAHYHTVDEVLTHLGLCLSHLPDDFYVESPQRGNGFRRPITDKQRMETATLLARGWRVVDVAAKVGISDKSVRKIRDRVG